MFIAFGCVPTGFVRPPIANWPSSLHSVVDLAASGILLGAWPYTNADPEKYTRPSWWYETLFKALDSLQTAAIETA